MHKTQKRDQKSGSPAAAKNGTEAELPPLPPDFNQTLAYVMTLHEGQTDKAGEPYILHLLRVSASLRDPADRIVALLHDAVEDGKTTFEQLLAMGYPELEVVTPLRFLTKGRDEPYLDFILRIATGPDRAIRVKRKDLRDNRKLKRLPKVTKKDEVRCRKYKQADKILDAALKMRRLLRAQE